MLVSSLVNTVKAKVKVNYVIVKMVKHLWSLDCWRLDVIAVSLS